MYLVDTNRKETYRSREFTKVFGGSPCSLARFSYNNLVDGVVWGHIVSFCFHNSSGAM